MENPADVTFWAFVTTVVIGATTAAVGWLRRGGRAEPEHPAMLHNAAIIDSSLVRDLLAQLTEQVILTRRLVETADALLDIERARDAFEQRRREAEHDDAVRERDALRRKLNEQERGKR